VELEQELQDFAVQARALADRIKQEDTTPSELSPEGRRRVSVLGASPDPPVIEQLRGIAKAIDFYRQERQIRRKQFPTQR
jgi:hypothetical protein